MCSCGVVGGHAHVQMREAKGEKKYRKILSSQVIRWIETAGTYIQSLCRCIAGGFYLGQKVHAPLVRKVDRLM